MMESNNIQYPETRIQDQPILTKVFIATAKYGYSILCNYRVNSDPAQRTRFSMVE
jgi:hypothetical protein